MSTKRFVVLSSSWSAGTEAGLIEFGEFIENDCANHSVALLALCYSAT
jgi:hypothetical protein